MSEWFGAQVYHCEPLALVSVARRADMFFCDVPKKGDAKGEKPWPVAGVIDVIHAYEPITEGWFCVITDIHSWCQWAGSLAANGRVVGDPVPLFEPVTNRVTYLVAGRPRSAKFARWGKRPAAYEVPRHMAEMGRKGERPYWLTRRIVEDYSREGELVFDPRARAGATLVGALWCARSFVGAEADAKNVAHCRKLARRPWQAPLFKAGPELVQTTLPEQP